MLRNEKSPAIREVAQKMASSGDVHVHSSNTNEDEEFVSSATVVQMGYSYLRPCNSSFIPIGKLKYVGDQRVPSGSYIGEKQGRPAFFDFSLILYSHCIRDVIPCFGCVVYSGVSAAAGLFLFIFSLLFVLLRFLCFLSFVPLSAWLPSFIYLFCLF